MQLSAVWLAVLSERLVSYWFRSSSGEDDVDLRGLGLSTSLMNIKTTMTEILLWAQ